MLRIVSRHFAGYSLSVLLLGMPAMASFAAADLTIEDHPRAGAQVIEQGPGKDAELVAPTPMPASPGNRVTLTGQASAIDGLEAKASAVAPQGLLMSAGYSPEAAGVCPAVSDILGDFCRQYPEDANCKQ